MDDYIAAMNDALAEEDDRSTATFTAPRLPVTFMIGLPRAGKTLFHQAVATALDVGYVSNLLNKFWRAPYLGACLERDLLRQSVGSSFQSFYGNTKGAGEPGEWGWFWRHWLGLTDGQHHLPADADLSALLQRLAAVESVKGKPLLFNNMYAVSNMDGLRRALGQVLIIDKPRDPYWICNSIINARVDRHGDLAAPFANRPREVAGLNSLDDPVERIVLEVRALRDEMAEIVSAVGEDRVFTVDFKRFLAEPRSELSALRDFWAGHGLSVEWTGRPLPDGFSNRDDAALIDPRYRERLDRYFSTHFGDDALPRLAS